MVPHILYPVLRIPFAVYGDGKLVSTPLVKSTLSSNVSVYNTTLVEISALHSKCTALKCTVFKYTNGSM